ncbi:hypothetical protein XELAEV_18002589mg [Xenopus laevis]|nr:hypothetical protein XELAEV_18002589mg [Xenopus laevis]
MPLGACGGLTVSSAGEFYRITSLLESSGTSAGIYTLCTETSTYGPWGPSWESPYYIIYTAGKSRNGMLQWDTANTCWTAEHTLQWDSDTQSIYTSV